MLLLYSRAEEGLDVFAVGSQSHGFENVRDGVDIAARAGEALVRGLGVRVAQAARAPRRRDLVGIDAGYPIGDGVATGTALEDLSATLLPADIRRVLEIESTSHLIIVPIADLGAVPFPMLEVPNLGPLVDHASITIAPSLGDVMSTTMSMRGRPREARRFTRPLVIGNPQFSDPEYVLQDLPGAQREAEAIAGLLDTAPIVGAAATKPRVTEASGQADLVYLATHGVADAANPLDGSFLALSASETTGSGSRWTAREIQHSKLAAELVVLSACQTGLGGTLEGGVAGLARAFQLAGAQQVIMTLWSIDDVATERIMQDVMVACLQGESVPRSVRLAMVAAKARGLPPGSWAPFVTFAGPFPFERDH